MMEKQSRVPLIASEASRPRKRWKSHTAKLIGPGCLMNMDMLLLNGRGILTFQSC